MAEESSLIDESLYSLARALKKESAVDMTAGDDIALVEGILTTARATGEITAYETRYAYDPVEEVLHVRASFALPSLPQYIRISISQPDDSVERGPAQRSSP